MTHHGQLNVLGIGMQLKSDMLSQLITPYESSLL